MKEEKDWIEPKIEEDLNANITTLTLRMDNNEQKKTYEKTYEKTYDESYKNIETKILGFCATAKSAKEIAEYCGFKGVDRFKRNYIKPLLKSRKLSMTIPDKPRSKKQKYKS